ncbi:MAG: hypothetical protein KBD78_11520 [Oligoflexales bacterium]|jgi:D-glycero-alpha-D-manno-heptose-7-phosphate kinase|nr:hypothetical protein [Oligoflexales bacterium]
MFLVKSEAPTRIDLAGGTLDLWPLAYQIEKKATVNVAIDLFARCEVSLSNQENFVFYSADLNKTISLSYAALRKDRELALISRLVHELWRPNLPALKISSRSGSPAGAGLGGSSAMAVAIAAALWRVRQIFEDLPELEEKQLVRLVQNAESEIIHAPTGTQDYWGAVRGGVNLMSYPYAGEEIQTHPCEILGPIKDQMLFCYTGISRASADNNWQVFKAVFEAQKKTLSLLEQIGSAAWECREAVLRSDFQGILKASAQDWNLRTQLWKDIETEETRRISDLAKENGAFQTRLGGAGGGGVMLIFVDAEKKANLALKLKEAGFNILDANITHRKLHITCDKA